jgi:hypothetical protein
MFGCGVFFRWFLVFQCFGIQDPSASPYSAQASLSFGSLPPYLPSSSLIFILFIFFPCFLFVAPSHFQSLLSLPCTLLQDCLPFLFFCLRLVFFFTLLSLIGWPSYSLLLSHYIPTFPLACPLLPLSPGLFPFYVSSALVACPVPYLFFHFNNSQASFSYGLPFSLAFFNCLLSSYFGGFTHPLLFCFLAFLSHSCFCYDFLLLF